MSAVYRPGHRYQGADGDVLFAIYSEHGTEFVTSRGTRVPMDEAERVYAPLTPLDTVPADKVRDLAAAIREALTVPTAEPGATGSHDVLLMTRTAHVRSVMNSLANGTDLAEALDLVALAADWHPVTYPTRDGAK